MGPLGGLGITEIIFIFLVVLLLFGAKRIPEIGSALGKGIREFKGSIREIEGEIKGSDDHRRTPPPDERREVSSPRDTGGSDDAGEAAGGPDPAARAPDHGAGDPGGAPEQGTGGADEGEPRTLTPSD